jgi:hypothetical protein
MARECGKNEARVAVKEVESVDKPLALLYDLG